MPTLNLKPTHVSVKSYYTALDQFAKLGVTHETAVRAAFQTLLEHCARKCKWTLVPEYGMSTGGGKRIVVDGALVDDFWLTHGYWEAKDIHDDLPAEVQRKLKAGYPTDNILFQTPQRAILWQNGSEVLDADFTDAAQLIKALQEFFDYRPQEYAVWEEAVAQFKDRVAEIGQGLAQLIRQERKSNCTFIAAFAGFLEKCRQSINPNLSEAAVEEMLIQHLLTERLFNTVFNNPDFTHRNVIASEIEDVIRALTSKSFSRADFQSKLDRFYIAIENAAATISDYSHKQQFLNTVYEQFFQGFSVKVADTHGIVYTPQPIVDFMVKSVATIVEQEFGRSLGDEGVHVIDPFVGTGNFIVRIMREIPRTELKGKYKSELHCNEVMLLPYYISSMNIEHEYYDATEVYLPFEGICLVDTFDLAEDRQMPLFAPENTQRVERQKDAPMFVVIGNPPYNMGQVNENDNNKNRKYATLDQRIRETYAKDSSATLKSALYDPYVKAIRWASDRILEEGVVAFVTNSSFLDALAFDGMRKHLAEEFNVVYVLDLGGNARKGLNVSDSSVFGIQVGVSINLLVKTLRNDKQMTQISYFRTDDLWTSRMKLDFLSECQHVGNIPWQKVIPDKRHTWLTGGLSVDFDSFVPLGTKSAKKEERDPAEVIFHKFSTGVLTGRDAWVYNYNENDLAKNIEQMIDVYNDHVSKWKRQINRDTSIDDFVISDGTRISWSATLKGHLKKGKFAEFDSRNIRHSFFRPFTMACLYFDRMMIDRVSLFPSIFPTAASETENRVIWLKVGASWPMFALVVNRIPNRLPQSGSQCFPFYTYGEDGRNRRENITDWALDSFRSHYRDETISKWDIFHYVYALLHHPVYRDRYQANLRLELPRIPFAPEFRTFAQAGARLAQIHVAYEEQPKYPLAQIETPDVPLDWRVERMHLTKDRSRLLINEFLTLDGIPSAAFDYRLGNLSALDWLIDQYCVKADGNSRIVNNPNRRDDPRYIVRLIGKVISVSLETVKIVQGLPDLGVPEE